MDGYTITIHGRPYRVTETGIDRYPYVLQSDREKLTLLPLKDGTYSATTFSSTSPGLLFRRGEDGRLKQIQ